MNRLMGWLARHRLACWTTIVPTLLAALYFGWLASDLYESQSRLVIRRPEGQVASPLGLLLKGAGFSRAQDDAYVLREYMLSRDAVDRLETRLGLRRAFARAGIDLPSRFDPLGLDGSLEAFHRYYQRRVSAQLDPASSILTLTTSAFTAADAVALNRELLELSEARVNALNARGRRDLLASAQDDLQRAQARDRAAALALAQFRNRHRLMDPERQTTQLLTRLTRVQEDLLALRGQRQRVQALAPASPQLPALDSQIQLLSQESAELAGQVAGHGLSLATQAAPYQALLLDKEASARLLASAWQALEQVEQEARRQQLYVERIAGPSVPDRAQQPQRLRGVLVVLVLGLVSWGILSLLGASLREHRD